MAPRIPLEALTKLITGNSPELAGFHGAAWFSEFAWCLLPNDRLLLGELIVNAVGFMIGAVVTAVRVNFVDSALDEMSFTFHVRKKEEHQRWGCVVVLIYCQELLVDSHFKNNDPKIIRTRCCVLASRVLNEGRCSSCKSGVFQQIYGRFARESTGRG